jgi:hypothetical protein
MFSFLMTKEMRKELEISRMTSEEYLPICEFTDIDLNNLKNSLSEIKNHYDGKIELTKKQMNITMRNFFRSSFQILSRSDMAIFKRFKGIYTYKREETTEQRRERERKEEREEDEKNEKNKKKRRNNYNEKEEDITKYLKTCKNNQCRIAYSEQSSKLRHKSHKNALDCRYLLLSNYDKNFIPDFNDTYFLKEFGLHVYEALIKECYGLLDEYFSSDININGDYIGVLSEVLSKA